MGWNKGRIGYETLVVETIWKGKRNGETRSGLSPHRSWQCDSRLSGDKADTAFSLYLLDFTWALSIMCDVGPRLITNEYATETPALFGCSRAWTWYQAQRFRVQRKSEVNSLRARLVYTFDHHVHVECSLRWPYHRNIQIPTEGHIPNALINPNHCNIVLSISNNLRLLWLVVKYYVTFYDFYWFQTWRPRFV